MENKRAGVGRESPNLSRETKLSGANADREKIVFAVLLTRSRIGNHTRLIHTLLKMFDTVNVKSTRYDSSSFDSNIVLTLLSFLSRVLARKREQYLHTYAYIRASLKYA